MWTQVLFSEVFILEREFPATNVFVDACLLVFTHTLLKKVSFALKADHFHPLKRILNLVDLWCSQALQQSVSYEFNVQWHLVAVHADKLHWQGHSQKLQLYLNSFTDNLGYSLKWKLVYKMGVQQTSEVGVKSLISRYQLIAKTKSRHQAAFL